MLYGRTSLANIIKLKFTRMEGTQFTTFGFLSVLSLLMFSLIDEDGSPLSHIMLALENSFLYASVFLMLLTIYDSLIRPKLFPNAR